MNNASSSRVPVNILLDILEYQGSEEYMNIPINEVVKRIQYYEPEFNYNDWLRSVKIKENFLQWLENNPLLDLYSYIKENEITLFRVGDILVVESKGDDPKFVYDIIDYLNEADRYGMISIAKQENEISVDNHSQLIEDLSKIWMWKEQQDINGGFVSYAQIKGEARNINISGAISIADALHIPTTLSGYLRYVIGRNKEHKRIEAYKEYTLYHILSDNGWMYFTKSNEIIIYMASDEEIDTIRDELAKIYGADNISFDIDTFKINSQYRLKLPEIELFYHPYTIHAYDEFK